MDAHFDAAAKNWDDKPERRQRAAVVAAAIRRSLPADGRPRTAVELGCGTGLLSVALADAFALVTAVDSSAGMLAVLNEKIRAAGLAHVFPLRVDLDDFPPGGLACDVVYALLALHHVPDHLALLRRCFAALNDRGLLFIADLEKEDGSFHSHIPDFSGHNGFDTERLQRDLERIGYRKVECDRILGMKREIGGVERDFGLFLLKAEKIGEGWGTAEQ